MITQDAGRVCLFAQYEPTGGIPLPTRRYLAALAACGFRLHVACSGATILPADDSAFLARIGAAQHLRPNRGLDFGAWSDLLRAGCAEGARTVLFANDSVFGPYGDLAAIVDREEARLLDAWGMVESNERVWHLQSWFVCLTAAALGRPAVQRVFAQDFAVMGKEEIILHGELGLGVALRAESLRCASAWGPPTGLRRLIPVNPSHFDWRAMLTSGAVPFVKSELLRDNPANLARLGGWRALIAALPGGDPGEIDAALATRTGSPGGPWRPPCRRTRLHRLVLNALLTRSHAAPVARPGDRV